MYDGPRPDSRNTGKRHPGKYQPMRKQGAIILATGGGEHPLNRHASLASIEHARTETVCAFADNSNGAMGKFCKC